MTPRTTLKLTFALARLGLFGAGIRLESTAFRWAGLALVAIAWFLRFWKGPAPE